MSSTCSLVNLFQSAEELRGCDGRVKSYTACPLFDFGVSPFTSLVIPCNNVTPTPKAQVAPPIPVPVPILATTVITPIPNVKDAPPVPVPVPITVPVREVVDFQSEIVGQQSTREYKCPRGDYVSSISVRSGGVVDNLTFKCNKGVSHVTGGSGGRLPVEKIYPLGLNSIIASGDKYVNSLVLEDERFGESSVGERKLSCPSSQVITGFAIKSDTYVNGIGIYCNYKNA